MFYYSRWYYEVCGNSHSHVVLKELIGKPSWDILRGDILDVFQISSLQKFNFFKKTLLLFSKVHPGLPRKSNNHSHRKCSLKKSVPKNFAKFTRKYLCQGLFLRKLQAPLFLRSTVLKGDSGTSVFLWIF